MTAYYIQYRAYSPDTQNVWIGTGICDRLHECLQFNDGDWYFVAEAIAEA